jgi:hypothetical protein
MSRPTEDELEDAAETGRSGCLLPQIDDAPESGEEGGDE